MALNGDGDPGMEVASIRPPWAHDLKQSVSAKLEAMQAQINELKARLAPAADDEVNRYMGVNDLSEPPAAGGVAQPPPMPPVEVAVLVSSDKDPKVQQEGTGTAASPEPEEAEYAKVFNEMDTNNDGGIDRAEWQAQGHDDASFGHIDANHDDKIDRSEWADVERTLELQESMYLTHTSLHLSL